MIGSVSPTAATRTAGTTPATSRPSSTRSSPTTNASTPPTAPTSPSSRLISTPWRCAPTTSRSPPSKAKYSGTPVGASESIFALLAPSLGLKLITPPSFLRAISEGTDVTAADRETIDRQIAEHRIKIYVYNSQNVTPDVQAQLREVKAAHIPYATITETLAPADTTYQAWQTRQLLRIEAALATAARLGNR